MTNELINKIKQKMQAYLGEEQMRQLHEVLCDCLSSSEEKPILVDTPLQIPDVLPVFEEEVQPKKKRRKLNVK